MTGSAIACRAWITLAAVLLAGCDTLGYYQQAISGQVALFNARRPIEEIMADPEAPSGLKAQLERARRMREFAVQELALPDNGSYRSYADLKRSHVVWNVFAAPALALDPKRWCFPIAGCVAYKGYFAQADAEAFAASLRREGYDVFVSGVPAYSTLGYFDDPLLNTFVHYPQAQLARLIFHELAHQVAYVRDDTVFNESFAVAVEQEGVRRWMLRYGTEAELQQFERTQERRRAFHALAGKYRAQLAQLYASALAPAEKHAAKTAVFAALAGEYQAFKAAWNGFGGYDPWLGPNANNATLASIGVYTQQVAAFQALLERAGGDLPRFYAEVRALAALTKSERDARLAAIVTTAAVTR